MQMGGMQQQQQQPPKESLAMSLPPELRHLADQDEEKVNTRYLRIRYPFLTLWAVEDLSKC
jgi:hypothetical protein